MNEDAVEQLCLQWLADLGWETVHGPTLLPADEVSGERVDERQVILVERLRTQLYEINEHLDEGAIEDAVRQVETLAGSTLVGANLAFHRMLTEGIDVAYQTAEGETKYDKCWLVHWDEMGLNELLAVNQYTVKQGRNTRRPDIVLFVNGLPLVVIELKNPAAADATIKSAWKQLQTYQTQIPALLQYSGIEVISDGLTARYGTISAGFQRFMRWPTLDGKAMAAGETGELHTLVHGLLAPDRLLDVIRHFIVFEGAKGDPIKKVAGYHQYFAVTKAVDATLSAVDGNGRGGVVWHTQGSGKSLSMVFYAGRISRHPDLANPTIVLLTDRQDLDNQLFVNFAGCEQLLRQTPRQAENRADLQRLLSVTSGGIVFTTIQKFFPEENGEAYPQLSDRHNIIVIADEAHRSQYDFIDGFARHLRDALPNATFLGFTGTPIESADVNTPAVFGDYIDIYDIEQAVQDGATVPIFYEGRLAKIFLDESKKPHIDEEFEEITETEEDSTREKLKTRWAAIEALIGTPERLRLIAEDLVQHFDRRCEAISGKAMVVVMSRRIAVDLYREIVRLRPEWHSDDDDKGVAKVIMTGSASDDLEWQPHIRNKPRRQSLATRFKDPDSDFRLVIVRDMWLTGFDAPSLHTMYVDKPMRGHGLMQAIARVNRVFQDKPGGLIVDYIGIAQDLKKALATYTGAGGRGKPSVPVEDAITALLEKLEILRDLFHGFDYTGWFTGDATTRLQLLPSAADFVLGLENGEARLKQRVGEMSRAFALCASTDEAIAVRDEVGFFQAVRAAVIKTAPPKGRADEELDAAVKQIVDSAVQPDRVIDIFKEAGVERPDIAILSDEFLEELRDMPQRNLALEALKKLLMGEIKETRRTNIVQSRAFSERLEEALLKYQNRSIEAAEVMDELIELAKTIRELRRRGEEMGMSEAEVAFYDALADNPSAVEEMGDETLKRIARELIESVRRSVTVDWTIRESAQAHMRRTVKRLLRKFKYPPDAQEKAVELVVQQAMLMGDGLGDTA